MMNAPLIYNKLDHTIRFGLVTSTSLDANGLPIYQVQKSKYELHTNIPLMQPEGFASRSISGTSDVVIANQSGDNNRGVIIVTRNKGVLSSVWANLNEGEVAIYSPFGQKIYLDNQGGITLSTGNGKPFTVDTSINVTGGITTTGDVVANGISLENHLHTGVQSGTSETGKPTG
jgi:phage gp45-like